MRRALLLVDVQYDFLPPDGALAVEGGDGILERAVYPLLDDEQGWDLVVASQDFHPPHHISFASRHALPPFSSTVVVRDPRTGRDKEQELWPDHCVQGTRGCEIEEGVRARMDRLRQSMGEGAVAVVQKGTDLDLDAYSAFSPRLSHPPSLPAPLTQLLLDRGIEQLVVCGLATDFCVRQTVLSALSPFAPRSPSEKAPWEVLVVRDGCAAVDARRGDEVLRELEEQGARVVRVEALLAPRGHGQS
ncbi:nicotinamidase [Rhodotorula paludigena]|uniref:nicotinamidase n=1 Tax=Rhodotorula paludigena TaxID=86838 RepID=UPI003181C507